jgi:hypothetical protein
MKIEASSGYLRGGTQEVFVVVASAAAAI